MTTDPTIIPLLDGAQSVIGYGDGIVLIMRLDGKPGMVYHADDVTTLIDKLVIAQEASRGNHPEDGAAETASRVTAPAAEPTVPTDADGDSP